jgi:transcriptional regulator with XRE-family HTH domain
MPPRKPIRSESQRRRLGAAIRVRRHELGLSQERLGELADCERNYVGRVEQGAHRIGLDILLRIASALKTTLAQLAASARI